MNLCRRLSSSVPPRGGEFDVKEPKLPTHLGWSKKSSLELMADCIIVAKRLGAAGPPPRVTFLGIHEQTQMLTQLIPENCYNGYMMISVIGEEVHPLCPSWIFFFFFSLLNFFFWCFSPLWMKGPKIQGVAYCTDCEAPWGQLVFMVYFENWLDINCPQSQDRTWYKAFISTFMCCSALQANDTKDI